MKNTPALAEEIRGWLTHEIAAILSLNEDEIDPNSTFDSFGLASRDAVSLSGDLEDFLNRRLSPTLLYQYPTIRQLADHLAGTATNVSPAQPASSNRAISRAGNAGAVQNDSAAAAESAEALSDDEVEAALLRKLADLSE